MALLIIGSAQNRGRMERRGDSRRPFVRDEVSVFSGQTIGASQQRLSRGRAQTNNHLGFDHIGFGSKPGIARRDFRSLRLFVNPTLAAFLEFEVLDGIGDVYLVWIYPCIGQCSSKDLAGRTNKGMPLPVFFIAGLLSDQDQPRRHGSFAEHSLGCEAI